MIQKTNKKTIPKIPALFFPLALLALVIIGSIWMYVNNQMIDTANATLLKKIKDIDTSIIEVNKEKRIKVYLLLEENKEAISELERYSQVSKMIRTFARIQAKYGLIFENINYKYGTASIAVTVKWNQEYNSEIALYQKVQTFIEQYRKEKWSPYTLEFIPELRRVTKENKNSETFKSITMNIKLSMKKPSPLLSHKKDTSSIPTKKKKDTSSTSTKKKK